MIIIVLLLLIAVTGTWRYLERDRVRRINRRKIKRKQSLDQLLKTIQNNKNEKT